MKISRDWLKRMVGRMVEDKIKPLNVYIFLVGDKKLMMPVSELYEPCEIIKPKFPYISNSYETVVESNDQYTLTAGYMETDNKDGH